MLICIVLLLSIWHSNYFVHKSSIFISLIKRKRIATLLFSLILLQESPRKIVCSESCSTNTSEWKAPTPCLLYIDWKNYPIVCSRYFIKEKLPSRTDIPKYRTKNQSTQCCEEQPNSIVRRTSPVHKILLPQTDPKLRKCTLTVRGGEL